MNNIFISIKGMQYQMSYSDMLMKGFCMSYKFSITREARGTRLVEDALDLYLITFDVVS